MSKEYLELDEFSHAFDYLQKAHFYLNNKEDKYWAKWVILSLSDALYHFMLCALGYSNYRKIIDYSKMNKEEKEISKSLPKSYTADERDVYDKMVDKYIYSGRGKVISFHLALDRIQDKNYLPHLTYVNKIDLLLCEIKNTKELRNTFRNYFQHFRNKTWHIEHKFMKPLLRATISIIEKIYKSNSLRVYYNKFQYGILNKLIDDVKVSIEEI